MNAKEIGASLRRARKMAWPDTSMEEASDRLAISRPYLSTLETGGKYPSFDLLMKMAEEYGCAVGDLLPATQLRLGDMEPLIAALQNLSPFSRRQVIAQTAGLIRSIASGVALDHQERHRRRGRTSAPGSGFDERTVERRRVLPRSGFAEADRSHGGTP